MEQCEKQEPTLLDARGKLVKAVAGVQELSIKTQILHGILDKTIHMKMGPDKQITEAKEPNLRYDINDCADTILREITDLHKSLEDLRFKLVGNSPSPKMGKPE